MRKSSFYVGTSFWNDLNLEIKPIFHCEAIPFAFGAGIGGPILHYLYRHVRI